MPAPPLAPCPPEVVRDEHRTGQRSEGEHAGADGERHRVAVHQPRGSESHSVGYDVVGGAVAATVFNSAVPSDPPICWVVLTRALATPESLFWTFIRAVLLSAGKARPRPTLIRTCGPRHGPERTCGRRSA